MLRKTMLSVLDHDALNIAQSAAYSALVSLFPALIVAAAFITWLPDSTSIRFQAALFFDRILPSTVSPLLESYFENAHRTQESTEAILIATVVSLVGASGVIVTLMEGFRRAFDLSPNQWGFWDKRWRSFALIPIALFPLFIVSSLVIFGHVITQQLAAPFAAMSLWHWLHIVLIVIVILVRWTVALVCSVGVIAAVYHMGVPPFCLVDERAVTTPVHPPRGVKVVVEDTITLPAPTVPSMVTSASSGAIYSALPPSVHESVQSSVSTLRAMSTMERSWRRTLPGALLATVLWFVTTLGFGVYVTRFANYSQVYGSLGVGIALLFWLYILSLSILIGAEFNAQLFPPAHMRAAADKIAFEALDEVSQSDDPTHIASRV